jgi:hypothetical protein
MPLATPWSDGWRLKDWPRRLFSLRAAQLVHNTDTITLRAACLVC